MRLSCKTIVNAPPSLAWELLADPENHLHFLSGITRWEVQRGPRDGRGMRIKMLIRVGAAEVGGLIEIVEWAPERELAWTSVTGIDQRGRWRIRKRNDGRTNIELRFAYGVAGSGLAGLIAERIGSRQMNRHLRKSVLQFKRMAETRQLERRHSAALSR